MTIAPRNQNTAKSLKDFWKMPGIHMTVQSSDQKSNEQQKIKQSENPKIKKSKNK
jgi:hypothetical protein